MPVPLRRRSAPLPEVFPTARPGASTGRRAATAASTLFLGSLVVLTGAGLVALGAHQTLLFPSLGPTAMLFFARPLPPEQSVGTTILAHWIGIAVGFACLALFGLRDAGAAVVSGVGLTRTAAAALSVAGTAAVLRIIRSPHAPAGASTLIVSLGVLTTPRQLGMMAASVVLVAVLGWAGNLLTGVRVPLWPDRRVAPVNEVGEQMPVPWRPARTDSGASTRVMQLPRLSRQDAGPR